ncbi:hypothetical protein BGW80DRAFT_1366240 [Lactifluus volemus]|nr:hypothetical protein BGW80DRAFT_1366240 [Lactifluus volemus]
MKKTFTLLIMGSVSIFSLSSSRPAGKCSSERGKTTNVEFIGREGGQELTGHYVLFQCRSSFAVSSCISALCTHARYVCDHRDSPKSRLCAARAKENIVMNLHMLSGMDCINR